MADSITTIAVTDNGGTPLPAQAISIPNEEGMLIFSLEGIQHIEVGFDGPASFEGYPTSNRSIRIILNDTRGPQPFKMPIPRGINNQLWLYSRAAGNPNSVVSVMILCGNSGGYY